MSQLIWNYIFTEMESEKFALRLSRELFSWYFKNKIAH